MSGACLRERRSASTHCWCTQALKRSASKLLSRKSFPGTTALIFTDSSAMSGDDEGTSCTLSKLQAMYSISSGTAGFD